jgi:outer membrane protein W
VAAPDVSEILVAPVGHLVREVCSAVAAAQVELDSASMKAQAALASTHPDLAEHGYQVTWYSMPEVAVELKLAMHFEESSRPADGSGAGKTKKARLLAAPFNAKYQNAFAYKADGSTLLKFRIVPVPPPPSASRP